MPECFLPDIRIRQSRSGDALGLIAVWDAAVRETHPFLPESFIEAERAALTEHYFPATETWVADRLGILGFVSVLRGNEIAGLFVTPSEHGQGIGRRLLDAVVKPGEPMMVEVYEPNLEARVFYRKYGFEIVNRRLDEETGLMMLQLRIG